MKQSLSRLLAFIFFINFSSPVFAQDHEKYHAILILIVMRFLHIPPHTQVTYERSPELQEDGELLDLSDLINRLLKAEDTDDDEEIEIRNASGQNFLLPIDDLIFRHLPHGGRGIIGRYLMREENGTRQHIFTLIDNESFSVIRETYLDVDSLRTSASDFELLFINPSYFSPHYFQSLEDLSNHFDSQNFYLEDDGLQVSGVYTRRYEEEDPSSSSSSSESLSGRENFNEVIEFERIEILNLDENLSSLALVLYPKFEGSDPDAEAFLVPPYLSLKGLSFRNRHVIFHRYNNLDQIFEIIKSYHSLAPLNYLELGFHASEESFDMRHSVMVPTEDGSFKFLSRDEILIQNSEANMFIYIRENIKPYLNHHTKIVLNGCLTGALDVRHNLVDIFSRLFPENEVSGPIYSISADREGSDTLNEGSWSFHIPGLGFIPITYSRLYRTTADLKDFRTQIERIFIENLQTFRSNFIFFHRENGLIQFHRAMIHSFIDSITHYSEYYTKRILKLFVGHIFSDVHGHIHAINPGQELINFLNWNGIRVDRLHQLDDVDDALISERVMDIELRDGFLRRNLYELEDLSTDTEEEPSNPNRKRKRDEDQCQESEKRSRTEG